MASARRTRDCRRAAFFITVTTTRVRVKDTIVLYYSILDVESGLNLHRPGMSGQSDETTSSVLTFMLLFYTFITFTGPCSTSSLPGTITTSEYCLKIANKRSIRQSNISFDGVTF